MNDKQIKFVILYSEENYVLTNCGKVFNSIEEATNRVKYFQENGHLSDAKIYRLEEIN